MGVSELRWVRADLDDRARRAAMEVLSQKELERYADISSANREGFLAGRLLLRRMAGDLLGIAPAAVDVVAVCSDCGGSHGQPVIPGSTLHVSLSRAGGIVVAAASWDAAIGIDVERVRQPARSRSAIGVLTGTPSILTWTRVEAILKADGRGLRVDPNQVEIIEVDDVVEGRVVDRVTRYRLSEVNLPSDLRVSVAVAS